jgi:transposase
MLGYSRRPSATAFRREQQSAWFDGMEAAFRQFGRVTEEVLPDNAGA